MESARRLWRKPVLIDKALVNVFKFCVPDYCKNMEIEEKIRRRGGWKTI